MKLKIAILTTTLFFITSTIFAQTVMKEYKAGHVFDVSLPDYMSKTTGLNDAASIQFKNSVKDIAGFIIFDTKEELEFANMKFSSVNEFYDLFIKDFLEGQKSREISQPTVHTLGQNKYVECDASYFDEESKLSIYYYVGIVETKNAYYKLLCYGGMDSKEKYKADFQKILYSIKD
ncbi:MAG: hypothetical protein H6Q14_1801 [Bacteroidetes bacterium]|jgi:hypothetical protein|nr:hypothetical protein [Bacteroidota bacterium]